MQQRIFTSIVFFVFTLFFPDLTMAQDHLDNHIYAGLLKQHVHGSAVNYDGFKKDEHLLDQYLSQLSRTDVASLSGNNQFAFYINAYNAFTIKLILSKYPGINSIKEISSFFSNPWNKKFIALQGRSVSLDHIEHDILRPRFNDPRIHFAINCASKSCPPLLNEPYDGRILDSQLDSQAKKFINNEKNTYFKGDTLYISKIFKWFDADFSGNPLIFIKAHASGKLREALDSSEKSIKIDYLRYDWSLNR